jgi:hypothetical protein
MGPGSHVGFPISAKNKNLVYKMAATAGHRLTLDPMGKCSNAFFSETTNMITAKLYMNIHWMVLYIYVLRWWPSWISDRHKKQQLGKGHSNDHSWVVWFQLSKRFFVPI